MINSIRAIIVAALMICSSAVSLLWIEHPFLQRVRQSLAVLVSAVRVSNSVPVGFESYRYYDIAAMYKPDCKSAQVFRLILNICLGL